MYIRKTKDFYNLMINYGYGHGFEYVCGYNTFKEAKQGKKEYIENEKFEGIKIVKKREKI